VVVKVRTLLLILFGVAAFWGFWSYGLFDLDEGIYAAALTEMRLRGDWLVPTYDGSPFFEKPILQYWVANSFLSMGVRGETALRLGSVLASLGTVWLLFGFARKRWGDTAAWTSAAVLLCSPLFLGVGRMFMPDALLLFFLTSSLLACWHSVEEGSAWWRIASCKLLGIAVLAKGPMALGVFLLTVAVFAWKCRDQRPRLRGGWLLGVLAFSFIVAIWYGPVLIREGAGFFQEFVIRQNIGRLLGQDLAHRAGVWFYVPVVIVAMAPFSWILLWVYRARGDDPLTKFLWIWATVVFVLFSLAGSKLPHYILPVLPPLALLIGRWQSETRATVRHLAAAWFLLIGFGLVFGASSSGQFERLLVELGLAALVGAILALLVWTQGAEFSVQAWVAAAPFLLLAMIAGMPQYWETTHGAVKRMAALARTESGPVGFYRMSGMGKPGVVSHPSFQWYVGERVASYDWPDEALARGGTILSRLQRFSVAAAGVRSRVVLLSSDRDLQLYRILPPPSK
jgi:4-amino-4-deoxy-L-arabinose transferase-like glycosyltransferase